MKNDNGETQLVFINNASVYKWVYNTVTNLF